MDEAASIHLDCFKLFLRECTWKDKLGLLCILATWRLPWRRAPNTLRLRDGINKLALPCESVMERLDLPTNITRYPAEVRQIIYQLSWPSPFWHVASLLHLVSNLSAAEAIGDVDSIRLCDISKWERGQRAPAQCHMRKSSYVRVTIDSRGIREMERLVDFPAFEHRPHEAAYFAFFDERNLHEYTAHFQVIEYILPGCVAAANSKELGLARLELQGQGLSPPQIWDTPYPPSVETQVLYSLDATPSTFRTIDLHETSGITFFFSLGALRAVHSHSTRAPDGPGLTFLDSLSRSCQQVAVWIYVPIRRLDPLTAFGVRRGRVGRPTSLIVSLVAFSRQLLTPVSFVPIWLDSSKLVPIARTSRRLWLSAKHPQS